METDDQRRRRHRARAGSSRNRFLGAACAAVAVLSVVAAPRAHAGKRQPPPPDEAQERVVRWWLGPWQHSMQETMFMSWMDASTGSTAWRWVMPPEQVNLAYLWWSAAIWVDGFGR